MFAAAAPRLVPTPPPMARFSGFTAPATPAPMAPALRGTPDAQVQALTRELPKNHQVASDLRAAWEKLQSGENLDNAAVRGKKKSSKDGGSKSSGSSKSSAPSKPKPSKTAAPSRPLPPKDYGKSKPAAPAPAPYVPPSGSSPAGAPAKNYGAPAKKNPSTNSKYNTTKKHHSHAGAIGGGAAAAVVLAATAAAVGFYVYKHKKSGRADESSSIHQPDHHADASANPAAASA
jgi:hypothetical protein